MTFPWQFTLFPWLFSCRCSSVRGVPVLCVLVPEQCRTFGSHSLGPSMEPALLYHLWKGVYLCSPVPMFPGTHGPRYLCSPVPMFPEPMFPGAYIPRYLCSPNLCSPVPMLPGTYVPRFAVNDSSTPPRLIFLSLQIDMIIVIFALVVAVSVR